MAKNKRNIISVDTIYPDSLRNQDSKYLTNFISYEDNVAGAFKENSLRNNWNDKTSPEEIKEILSVKSKGKKFVYSFGAESIGIDDVVNLSPKVKSTDEYVYRVRDWEDCQWPKELYCTEKEVLEYVDRKVKNKYIKLLYNGTYQKIEYTPEGVRTILASMAPKTTPVLFTQVTRDGSEYWYEITIYKNSLKK